MMAKMGKPRLIAHTELWTARMRLNLAVTPERVQDIITRYVNESGISVIGYVTHNPTSLTLLRWPDTRPEYHAPSIPECEQALGALTIKLHGTDIKRGIVPPNTLHTMMGRGKDGYNPTEFAPLADFERPGTPGYGAQAAHMVTARVKHNGSGTTVEPYDEAVAILTMPASPANEAVIHEIGDEAQQWHYAIERGPCSEYPNGRMDFYETRWAK